MEVIRKVMGCVRADYVSADYVSADYVSAGLELR